MDGLVQAQVNAQVNRVRRMFEFGVEQALVLPAVLQSLGAIKGLRKGRFAAKEGRRVTPVPDVYLDALRPFVGRVVWAMIELRRLTGMRPGEVAVMRTIDIAMVATRGNTGPPSTGPSTLRRIACEPARRHGALPDGDRPPRWVGCRGPVRCRSSNSR